MTGEAPGRGGDLLARLQHGESVLGCFVQTPHPVAIEALAGAGFDFLCAEAEHSPLGRSEIHAMVRAGDACGVPVLVRVADCTAADIAGALDAGACGVLVPRTDDAAAAQLAARLARYPPAGARGLGPSRATGYGRDLPRYFAAANDRTLVGVQVETARGLEHLDEIATDGDADVVFIGPGDLAASLGASLQAPSREFQQTVSDMVARVRSAGAVAGIFAATPEAAAGWIERGVRLVIMGSDVGLLAASASSAVEQVRNRADTGTS